MASRGRGGRGRFPSNLNTEEPLPPVIEPPPTYPPLEKKPLPLENNPEMDYLLNVKQRYLLKMQEMPTFIKEEQVPDIERYSDRYKKSQNKEKLLDDTTDYSRLPSELNPNFKRKRKIDDSGQTQKKTKILEERLNYLEAWEQKQKDDDDRSEDSKSESDETEDEQEPEEEEEEENDYIVNYGDFENGDSNPDSDDDDTQDTY